ncbi:choice-of-anchor I family protein [Macrococcoides caseolyticum]|uniref:choice-of-anchor I family protein n=1 Tax=Macrococcoides caseolyticum TaxID=69966 RepID=UPI001F25B557|nr:choice-of-anchor I family protein [Macrococcus caseolyticus]MCE4956985.1 choice-of-anchor I family protein [Macrococcus caseolyticus]
MKKVSKMISTLALFSIVSTPMADAQSVNSYGSNSKIKVSQLARYDSETEFGESGTEIVSYDTKYKQAYSINGALNAVDILDMSRLSKGKFTLKKRIFLKDLGVEGSDITSVAVNKKYHYIAVSIPAKEKTDNGLVAFLNKDGKLISKVSVGALPDMLTFTHDNKKLIVANEGEPNDAYTINPEGSVSSIKVNRSGKVKQSAVKTVRFKKEMIPSNLRYLGRNADESFLNLEPEYVTIDENNKFAYITIQERNAIAKFDIKNEKFVKVKSLGYKSYLKNKIDVSDKDNKINMQNYPLLGMYQPDGIAQMKIKGKTYLLTANEGDAQDYEGFSEETRIADIADQFDFTRPYLKNVTLDQLKDKKGLGRLKTTTSQSFVNKDGKYTVPVTFGGRSFSIRNANDLGLVYDSGSDFETITAQADQSVFNSQQEEIGKIEFDSRSDDKGPEPESVVTGNINGKTYAFIGLERVGGIMVYNVSNPKHPVFETYFKANDNKDISPEGLTFISAKQSPTKKPLLLASHEMSGTIAAYELSQLK